MSNPPQRRPRAPATKSSWSEQHPVLNAALGLGAGAVSIMVLARIFDPYTWRGRPIP